MLLALYSLSLYEQEVQQEAQNRHCACNEPNNYGPPAHLTKARLKMGSWVK